MLRRSYPPRKKGQLQPTAVKSVRLSIEAASDLEGVIRLWHARFNPTDCPSLSMCINRAIVQWVASINASPTRLAAAHKELLADSTRFSKRKFPKADLKTIAKALSEAKSVQ